ncbi:DUF6492 family protein [Leptothoe spongobia]|uniref:Uncharacterized protein n=1 Tax=Leptothoe spongobia TAU-MAC 1115 TaxID=1967444 RepID=A0A947DJX1_9CYAN|nr:DUF6492 family protein [Leptothoe spongobia]MBT9317474.1 hypothetical protein [Leptothoe spongobia TAU-MAC 1115]
MTELTYAFITPSYAPDFQRCQLLCWSIKQFISFPINHYIVVDSTDYKLFSQLADKNTKILTKEEIFPPWFRKVPFLTKKNVWINLQGYKSGNWLLRGWLVQQLIKLSAAEYTSEEVLIFADSDAAFITRFDVRNLVDIEQNQVRLFRVPHTTDHDYKLDGNGNGKKWKDAAKRLLSLPKESNYYDFYVSQIVTWRRSNLLKLYAHIEEKYNENWLKVMSGERDLSEYVLYGLFVNYVLGEGAGHYDDHLQKICQSYWKEESMSFDEVKEFVRIAKSKGFKSVMVSAKSDIDISIEQFQSMLFQKVEV